MMKRTMLPFLAAAAVSLHAFGAAAQSVPTFDVGPLCRAEAKAAPELAGPCMADQKKAHEDVVRQWATFAPESRSKCIQMVSSIAGLQSYIELLTCLQMDRDVKSLPKE